MALLIVTVNVTLWDPSFDWLFFFLFPERVSSELLVARLFSELTQSNEGCFTEDSSLLCKPSDLVTLDLNSKGDIYSLLVYHSISAIDIHIIMDDIRDQFLSQFFRSRQTQKDSNIVEESEWGSNQLTNSSFE